MVTLGIRQRRGCADNQKHDSPTRSRTKGTLKTWRHMVGALLASALSCSCPG